MRAFSSGRISVSIALLAAVFVVGTMVVAQDVGAREPEKELMNANSGGGTSGGAEWKTDPTGGVLPVDEGKAPGPGPRFGEDPPARAEDSWGEPVEAWYIRLLKAVSAIFVQKYF